MKQDYRHKFARSSSLSDVRVSMFELRSGFKVTAHPMQAQQHAQQQQQLVAQRQSATAPVANGTLLPHPEAAQPAVPAEAAASAPKGHRTPPPASPAKSADWQARIWCRDVSSVASQRCLKTAHWRQQSGVFNTLIIFPL